MITQRYSNRRSQEIFDNVLFIKHLLLAPIYMPRNYRISNFVEVFRIKNDSLVYSPMGSLEFF